MPARYRTLAALLVFLPLAGLLALPFLDPRLAARLVDEEGPVEIVQVVYCAVAAALALLRARALARTGRSPAFDLVIAALLATIAVGELDLDRWIFGTKIVGTRFFFAPRKPVAWPWRALTALVVIGVPVAVGLYVIARFGDVVRGGLAAVRQPWGRVLLAGFVIFAASQVLERVLDRIGIVSAFFLEEAAEFAGAVCFVVAYVMQPSARDAPRRP